jgi:hypothetical protein
MALRVKDKKRNPWFSEAAGTVTLTVGAEADNAINVAGVLKGPAGQTIGTRVCVKGFFVNDANGDTLQPHYLMPSGGYAAGANGFIIDRVTGPDGLLADGGLAISATPEKFKTTSIAEMRVGGRVFTKAATDNLTFTAAHVITASKFGVVLVQSTGAGTISTKVPGTPQAYASAALALAALPAPDANNIPLGHIAIANNAGDWTANTDDLTNGSDVTTAAFVDAPENGQYGPSFSIQAESNGKFDITITETRVATYRLAVVLPDGSITVSDPITFA